MDENEKVATELARHYQKGREEAIDEVLDILKHHVLFPPQQSSNIYKKVTALKSSHSNTTSQEKSK